jgi:uncharacterized integral membrane protein
MSIALIFVLVLLGLLAFYSSNSRTVEPSIVYVVQTRQRPQGCLLVCTFLVGFLVALFLVASR